MMALPVVTKWPFLCSQGGSYNFQSHDSGHGTGSENDSPHLTLNNVRYLASAPTMERPAAVLVPVQPGEMGPRVNPEFFAVYQHQQAAQSRRGGRSQRSHSPYHTYMEVDGDPVYEEIERHEPRHQLLVSDVSDEDRKQSDMSRQSSQRTCSDNRPLIQYGGEPRGPAGCAALSEARLRDFDQAQMYHDLRRLRGYGENVAMAVLSGDQVVCQLQPPHLAAIREGATLPVDRARPSHSRFAEC